MLLTPHTLLMLFCEPFAADGLLLWTLLQTVNSSKEVKSRYGYQCSTNHTHHHGQHQHQQQHQQQQTHAPRRTTTATKSGPGDGALPSFRSSLRRTSGNLRDCEKVRLKKFIQMRRRVGFWSWSCTVPASDQMLPDVVAASLLRIWVCFRLWFQVAWEE